MWIVGRPKNNSKLRSSDGSCKGRKGNSLNPGRFICGLGGSGGRSESSCWHGVEGRKHHGAVILSQGRGRTDRVYFLSRVLKILVVGLIGVSGMCRTIQVAKCWTDHRKSDAAKVVVYSMGDVGRSRNVWLDHGREEVPEADWLHARIVAPTVFVTPSHMRISPRGFLVFCSMPPEDRGSFRGGGSYPGTSVAFFVARCSSNRRYGAGKKNGDREGASDRGEARTKGKTKGICL